MTAVPRTLQGAPELSTADRDALTLLTEHARERARLDCVWLFAHPPELPSDAAIELIAHACVSRAEALAEAAARAATARTVRGDRRRFGRGAAAAPAQGTLVETSTGAELAISAAGQPASAAATDDGEQALRELTSVALRLISGGQTAVPAATAKPPARAAREPDADDGKQTDQHVAYGAGLASSLALLEDPPILAESRARLLHALEAPTFALGDAVQAIETDIGLALAITRRANRTRERPRGGVLSIPQAIGLLGPDGVASVLEKLPVPRNSGSAGRAGQAIARITPHSLIARAAADAIALQGGMPAREQLRLAAMLHDIGKVALAGASQAYFERGHDASVVPEERAERERRRLGIDHAGLGAIALRRLGLPKTLAETVEHHHSDEAEGAAAVVRLADMLAHETLGHAVDPAALARSASAAGVDPATVPALLYDLARSGGPRGGAAEPSPLTPAQQRVLQGLRRGLTYKQIAADLQVSESTVRSHLHKTYERLGVIDRAQAVLLAHDRGWI